MRPLKAGLIYFLLIFALGWVLGPIRNSGGAEVRSHGGPARQSCHHADSDDRLITLGDARFSVRHTLGSTIPMGLVALAILIPAEIAGVSGCEGYPYRNICEIRDRSQRHFGGDVPAV
jgi:hypothetical protein